ncbi:MAG: VOC family protein [Pseudomonadota bacterium]
MGHILGIDHVQLAIPVGAEEHARQFYGGVLGLEEIPKPVVLAVRGGVWFSCGITQIHLGSDPDFQAAKKAHPALVVADLPAFATLLEGRGVTLKAEEEVNGRQRATLFDPFGNRIELIAS